MTLKYIWRSFQPMLSFPPPISRKLYTTHPQKLKLLARNHTTAFRWYDCRWLWRYFKVIRLFHIKILVDSAWYGKSYYKLLTWNYAVAFDWCHFWWPWMTFWRSFQSRLPFPRPISQKLYKMRSQMLELFIRNHARTFKWYVHCRWPWRYFKVIRLYYIKFLVNGKSYHRVLIGNHTL